MTDRKFVPTPERPRRAMIQLRNTVTNTIKFVRFGSPEHKALAAEFHPMAWNRQLWEQIFDPRHPWS